METEWDVVIVGAGAAGLSAGVVLARTGVRVVAVDGRAPRNAPAEGMHGFLSRDGMNPLEFLAAGRREMVQFGGKILAANADRASRTPDGRFSVVLDDGSALVAPVVLIATGVTDVLTDIRGVAELWGGDVHHCPHCHGAEVRDRKLAVIGGEVAPMSLHQAVLMHRYSSDVIFFPNGIDVPPETRAALTAFGVHIIEGDVAELESADGRLQAVQLSDGRLIERDAAFIAPRTVPHDSLLAQLGVAGADAGYPVDVGPTGRTGVTGVWAAGNVVNPRAQVISAAGDGATAAIDITAHLLEREMRRVVETSAPTTGA